MYRGLRRSLGDFGRHPWLHFFSIATISVALIILGAFYLFYRNLEVLAERTSPAITGTLYLKEGLTPTQTDEILKSVLAQSKVKKAVFKSKDVVFEELQSFLGGTMHQPLTGGELF